MGHLSRASPGDGITADLADKESFFLQLLSLVKSFKRFLKVAGVDHLRRLGRHKTVLSPVVFLIFRFILLTNFHVRTKLKPKYVELVCPPKRSPVVMLDWN